LPAPSSADAVPRLAVKDAEGAAQRAKLLDREGHGHTLSRAARRQHQPSSLTPAGQTSLLSSALSFQPATADACALSALPVAIPALHRTPRPAMCGPRCPARLPGATHDSHDPTRRRTQHRAGARTVRAPRRPGAKRSRPPIISFPFSSFS